MRASPRGAWRDAIQWEFNHSVIRINVDRLIRLLSMSLKSHEIRILLLNHEKVLVKRGEINLSLIRFQQN